MNDSAIIFQQLLRNNLQWLMMLSDVPGEEWDLWPGAEGWFATTLPGCCALPCLAGGGVWEGETSGVGEIQLFYLSSARKSAEVLSASKKSPLKSIRLQNQK